jgi:predicted transcriptional regulator
VKSEKIKVENKALRKWATDGANGRGSGRITALAKHIGVAQPAVTKMIDGSVRIKFEYIQGILDFTGIKAKDLLPEYYNLFEKDLERIERNLNHKLDRLKCDAMENLKNSLNIIKDS